MDASIDQKIEELQRICRKVDSGLVAMRIILLIMKMLSLNEEIIDRVLGFCDRTKQTWIDRYNENSTDGLEDLPRTGRKSNLNEFFN